MIFIRWLLLVSVCSWSSYAMAQEKPVPPGMKEQQTRVADPQQVKVQKSDLPRIDLPEFVITGIASIDLPKVEKIESDESSLQFFDAVKRSSVRDRERETVELAVKGREQTQESSEIHSARFTPDVGTFFTSNIGLWLEHTSAEYSYTMRANYDRMMGFAPYTDRSGGNLELNGGMRLLSNIPFLDRAAVKGKLGYGSESFHFYGSTRPDLTRTTATWDFGGTFDNSQQSSFPYSLSLEYGNFAVTDSSATVNENEIKIGFQSQFSVASFPVRSNLRLSTGAISGASSGSLSQIELSVESQNMLWNDFSARGSIHLSSSQGMGNQSIVRVYPHLSLAYRLTPEHRLTAQYDPSVRASSLSSAIATNRYLSATSVIRHPDISQSGTLALESDWTEAVRTRIAARGLVISDYPLFADSLFSGVWKLAYAGRATITSLTADLFAKLTANDYFASSLSLQTSKNSDTGEQVPYLPEATAALRYDRVFGFGLSAGATITFVHQRQSSVVGGSKLPGFLLLALRSEYQIASFLKGTLEIQNGTNQSYQLWQGYQELPFRIAGGLMMRW